MSILSLAQYVALAQLIPGFLSMALCCSCRGGGELRSLLCLSPGPELPVFSSFTYTSGSGIAESSGNSMLIFGGTVKLFSTEFAPFYLLPSNVQGFQFLHLLVDACHFPLIFFSYSHTIGYEVVSCDFDLHLPND